jgi:AraC family transcriptional regulator
VNATFRAAQVNIVQRDDVKVAVLEHRGDSRLLKESVQKFVAWRKQNNLAPATNATFNIVYDTPIDADPNAYFFDLCVATDREVGSNSFAVVSKIIPGGRCAVLRHIGSDDRLGDAVSYLYCEWLAASGEEAGDFPMYFQRVTFFPHVPQQEAITDVFLPLR